MNARYVSDRMYLKIHTHALLVTASEHKISRSCFWIHNLKAQVQRLQPNTTQTPCRLLPITAERLQEVFQWQCQMKKRVYNGLRAGQAMPIHTLRSRPPEETNHSGVIRSGVFLFLSIPRRTVLQCKNCSLRELVSLFLFDRSVD